MKIRILGRIFVTTLLLLAGMQSALALEPSSKKGETKGEILAGHSNQGHLFSDGPR